MTITETINKTKLWAINTKAYIYLAIVVFLLITLCIALYRHNQNIKNEIKIEKVTQEKQVTEKEVENKTKELKKDVVKHGEFVKSTSKEIITIVNKKPKFKPMNYESTKIKDASYNAMRLHLDTVQPNK